MAISKLGDVYRYSFIFAGSASGNAAPNVISPVDIEILNHRRLVAALGGCGYWYLLPAVSKSLFPPLSVAFPATIASIQSGGGWLGGTGLFVLKKNADIARSRSICIRKPGNVKAKRKNGGGRF